MISVREATSADGQALADFFLRIPIQAGTEFVLDRSPDFMALLRLRGEFSTFVAHAGPRLAGTVSALWHDALEDGSTVRVGEIVDLRVAEWARGGPATAHLLQAVRDTFESVGVDWAVCLLGDHNAAALPLVRGRVGLPALYPLARYVSVHFVACRLPAGRLRSGFTVREATSDDAPGLAEAVGETMQGRRLAPRAFVTWPDPAGRHKAWVALDPHGRQCGGLILWDGTDVRRIRVSRYRGADRLLRAGIAVASRAGLVMPLPPPGGVLRMWAARWLDVRGNRPEVVRALVRAALRAGAQERLHVVQINLPQRDPILPALPGTPHSCYWSTLYGCRLRARGVSETPVADATYHVDVALV